MALISYDEFDKEYRFTYKGKEYIVPPISQKMSELLVEVNSRAKKCLDSDDIAGASRTTVEYIATAMAGLEGTEEEVKNRVDTIHKELLNFSRPALAKLQMTIMTELHGYPEMPTGEELDRTKKH